jgi:hypothetical protein
MKLVLRNLLFACLFLLAGDMIAQPPPGINYQSVAKDPTNNVAKNRDIYVKGAIRQKSITGTIVWEESFLAKSDNDGIFTIVIGQGTKAGNINIKDISLIDWANGPFYFNIKVAVAPSIPAAWWVAADNYLDMGTTQMMSVPYAMFAGNASVTNVTTSIPPGPFNTFLITDSSGNVSWATPQAASTTVTTVQNFKVELVTGTGQNVIIPPNTTASLTVPVPGVKKGDPILVTPQDDYQNWSIYSSWVVSDGLVGIRIANYTDQQVLVLGSQYKIVIIK